MISETVQTQLNNHLHLKFESSYFFLNVSLYFSKNNKDKLSNFFKEQSKKDLTNGMKLYDYILKREGEIIFQHINNPNIKPNTLCIINDICDKKSFSINNLKRIIDISKLERDYSTVSFLEKFTTIECEEEDKINALARNLK